MPFFQPRVGETTIEIKTLAKLKPDLPADAQPKPKPLAIRPAEARLYEVASKLPGNQIVVVSVGRAQSAGLLASARPKADVTAWYLDSYRCKLAADHYESTLDSNSPANQPLFQCDADWPIASTEPVDMVLVEQPKTGEAELGRDLFQTAWHHLKIGGALVAATDNAKDKWLLEQLQAFDKSIKTRKFNDATVYYLIKQKPLKRLRDYSCQIAFRDEENLLQLVTRPGVFAHRKLDTGARQIMNAVEVFPESRMIEIGCGSGAISMALAKREPSAFVLAIDSNARAIDCLRRGLEINELANVEARVNFDGQLNDDEVGQFAMALCNPPYYADFRIAQHFIETAIRALRPGGRIMLVTRKPQWYRDNLAQWFDDCEVFESRRYHIATGVKPTQELAP